MPDAAEVNSTAQGAQGRKALQKAGCHAAPVTSRQLADVRLRHLPPLSDLLQVTGVGCGSTKLPFHGMLIIVKRGIAATRIKP
jgi:hypothetical protein